MSKKIRNDQKNSLNKFKKNAKMNTHLIYFVKLLKINQIITNKCTHHYNFDMKLISILCFKCLDMMEIYYLTNLNHAD